MVRSAEWGGSPQAPAVLARYRADVRGYFMRRLNRSPEDVEDLTQEVCLQFLALDQRRWPEKPRNYLFGMARNVLADFLMQRARESSYLVSDIDDYDEPIEHDQSAVFKDPEESVSKSQWLNLLLLELPSSQRRVLLAHEHEGYSYREAASRLGFTCQTVEKYLTQAKAQLRCSRCNGG